jgi:transcriptional regulator with XRE-family HTH domain
MDDDNQNKAGSSAAKGRSKKEPETAFIVRFNELVNMLQTRLGIADDEQAKKFTLQRVNEGTDYQLGRTTVHDLLTGKHTNPTFRTIRLLAKFFQISPAFFFEENQEFAELEKDIARQRLLTQMMAMGEQIDFETLEQSFLIMKTLHEAKEANKKRSG